MIISARCDLIIDLDIPVTDINGNSLIAEARAAFVQGNRNVVKLYSNGGITICNMENSEQSFRIRVHLTPADTAKFKAGPNSFVDFQLFMLPQHLLNNEMVPEGEPIASEVISIPVKRSLAEAIIDLGGELVED